MVVAIVLNAFLNFGKPILREWKAVLIAVLSFVGFLFQLNTCPGLHRGGSAGFSASSYNNQ